MSTRGVVSIPADGSVLQAAQRMRDHQVGCLIVTDAEGRLAGILSERDIVNQVADGSAGLEDASVAEIMTADVTTCPAGTRILEAGEIMSAHGVRHLPLVEDGVPVGIVSVRDVMAEQIRRDRAMRAAAEQVALLSTCLKTLDLDEVVSMVVNEVPKLFGASRCVLWLPKNGGPEMIRRHYCPCRECELHATSALEQAQGRPAVLSESVPETCADHSCEPPRVLIPLHISGLGDASSDRPRCLTGYVCMCGLSDLEGLSPELVAYKGSLVREVLNANLTNARLYEEMRRRSVTDTLTGVSTRRVFEEKLDGECRRADRYNRGFCVAIVDVDHFKLINDKLGHSVGDRALSALGRCMLKQRRATDVLARYGGDEFILLLPETELHNAVTLMERIRVNVMDMRLDDGTSLTVSCGVVARAPGSRESANELVRRADMALYEAKRSGRNRTKAWRADYSELHAVQQVNMSQVKALEERVAEMSAKSKEMFIQSIWGLIRALEARDPFTKNHSENVMRYAVGIAETLGMDAEEVAIIRRGAMIHDIGKIGVPDAILRKPGELTRSERRIMEEHPIIAVRILDQMRFLEREIPIVRYHHERWDGTGYPDGLRGTEIPRNARVLGVADALDAITSDRTYHRSRSLEQAMATLEEAAGSQFDPETVDALKGWIEQVRAKLNTSDPVTVADLLEAQKTCFVAA